MAVLRRVAVPAALAAFASAVSGGVALAQTPVGATADTESQAQMLAQLRAMPLAAAGQTGYDGYLCNAPSTGIAIRDRASDSGVELGRIHNGDPLHVYATHSSRPNIPVGWALGYGRPGGGSAVDGYFKTVVSGVGVICR